MARKRVIAHNALAGSASGTVTADGTGAYPASARQTRRTHMRCEPSPKEQLYSTLPGIPCHTPPPALRSELVGHCRCVEIVDLQTHFFVRGRPRRQRGHLGGT
jgi:hypothetical protein